MKRYIIITKGGSWGGYYPYVVCDEDDFDLAIEKLINYGLLMIDTSTGKSYRDDTILRIRQYKQEQGQS